MTDTINDPTLSNGAAQTNGETPAPVATSTNGATRSQVDVPSDTQPASQSTHKNKWDLIAPLGAGIELLRQMKSAPAAASISTSQIKRFHQLALSLDEASGDVAEESSASLRLAQKIQTRKIDIPSANERLEFIFECLNKKPAPRLVLARDARLQLQVEVYSKSGRTSRVLAKFSDGSPVGLVLAALVASLIVWVMLALLVYSFVNYFKIPLAGDIFFMNGRALAVISSAAFVGGVISIATRLQEFSRVRDLDPFAMFWTALLKPLIGVILSFFILATLAGGVITFGFLPETAFTDLAKPTLSDGGLKALYVLWMLGFLAGFSERFAWDFVNRAEGSVSGPGTGSKNATGGGFPSVEMPRTG